MAGAPGIPQNLIAQTANMQNLVSWDLSTGATSYNVLRSLDNVTYTLLATVTGSPLATSYLDMAVVKGAQYWYVVNAQNSSGTSPNTNPDTVVPTPTGEQCLSQIRLAAQQRADRVNSNFVTKSEWNNYINQAMFELYDLLVTIYEDYFIATPIQFTTNGVLFQFPLPDGIITYNNGINPNTTLVAPALYKLTGVDLALNNATNAYVTVNKFNFIDRNRFVYPNTASTIYGVFNMQYRMLGSNIEFIPTPTAGQQIRLWYIPRLTELLQDTDITTQGISGWIEYVIVRAAKYALDKEESDTTKLDQQIIFLKTRIEESAANRDAGQSDTISDTRSNRGGGFGSGGFGSGWGGGSAGWAMLFVPISFSNNSTNSLLTNSIFFTQPSLIYVACFILSAYFLNLFLSKNSRSTIFTKLGRFFNWYLFPMTFFKHVMSIISCRAQE